VGAVKYSCAVYLWSVADDSMSGVIDIFELESVDKRLQAISHGLRRVGIDDEYRTHLAVSGVAAVTVFAH
jgi:hypothetical protein